LPISGFLSNLNILTRFINLEELYLCNNNLTTESIQCLSQLTKLRILALSHNKIDNIDNLSALLNLKELYLDNNDITDASALHNLNFQQLHIINNKLSNINGLYNVNVLVVSQNYIIDNNEIKRFNGLQIAVSYALFCNDLYPNNELLNIIMEYANTHGKYDLELSKNFYNDNKIKLPFIKGKVVYEL
jgi:internalin A